MRSLMCLLILLSAPSTALAEGGEAASDAPTTEKPEMPWTPIPEAMRDDMPGLGFAFGAGSIAFSFAGVPTGVVQSLSTAEAAEASSLAETRVSLQRSSTIHAVSAGLAAGRVLPAALSMIGLGVATDDASMLHALGTPYIVLGVYDLVGAALSGVGAINLFEDRSTSDIRWSGGAREASDASIEAGGAWAGGMLAVGMIELIVGGLALHGALAMEAERIVILPTPGGLTLAGRF